MIINIFGPSGSGKTLFVRHLLESNNTQNFFEQFINKKINENLNEKISISLIPLPKFRGSVQDFFEIFSINTNILLTLKNDLKDLSESIFDEITNEKKLINISTRRLETLSAGELRRLFLLKSLLVKSNILIIDEPFSNSDEKLWKTIFKAISISQKSIILSHFSLERFFAAKGNDISININMVKNIFNA